MITSHQKKRVLKLADLYAKALVVDRRLQSWLDTGGMKPEDFSAPAARQRLSDYLERLVK